MAAPQPLPVQKSSPTEWEWAEPPYLRRQYFKLLRRAIDKYFPTRTTSVDYAAAKAAPPPPVAPHEIYHSPEEIIAMASAIKKTYDEDVVILSADGVRLGVFMKNGLARPWQYKVTPVEETTAAIHRLMETYPPRRPSDHDMGHMSMEDLGARFGAHNFGSYRFGLEHTPSDPCYDPDALASGTPGYLSADVLGGEAIGNSFRFSDVYRFYYATAALAQTIGLLFSAVDPDACQRAQDRFHALLDVSIATASSAGSCAAICPRAPVDAVAAAALAAPPDDDEKYRGGGWVAVCCFGDFTGGDVLLPELDVRLCLRPGDVLFLRAPAAKAVGRALAMDFEGKIEEDEEDGDDDDDDDEARDSRTRKRRLQMIKSGFLSSG
ncbi:MAG: hypothetical protein M1826_007738 [Phylliscum demangeonii]|nr:MAG: hypothetical protein M1826_007738 [Phylliscum demangeonii]